MRKTISMLMNAGKTPPLLFFLVIYLIGVTTNSLSDYIIGKDGLGISSALVTLIGLFILTLIFFLFDPVARFVNFYMGKGTLETDLKAAPSLQKGLIVFANIPPLGQPMPAEPAIRYHSQNKTLKHCWIITGGEKSYQAANSMITNLKLENGLKNINFTIKPMTGDHADNPAEVYKLVEEIFNDLPDDLNESDIIADYTGGTKSMTTGMILSCALPSRNLQFMKPNQYKEDGTALREAGSEPRQIDINFKLKQVYKA